MTTVNHEYFDLCRLTEAGWRTAKALGPWEPKP
jgi:hypothetical protein